MIDQVLIADEVGTEEQAFALIAKTVEQKLMIDDSQIQKKLEERERLISTGVGDGVAIPHALVEKIKKSYVILIKSKQNIEWEAIDRKPVHIIIAILVSPDNPQQHLQILSNIALVLSDHKIINSIIASKDPNEIQNFFIAPSTLEVEKKAQNNIQNDAKTNDIYDLVAITCCPSGLAHTYLSRDALIEECRRRHLSIKVQTIGYQGIDNALSEMEIAQAQGVILAVDKVVDLPKIKNNNVIKTRTVDVVRNPKKIIDEVLNLSTVSLKKQSSKAIKFYKGWYAACISSCREMFLPIKLLGFFIGLIFVLQTEANVSDNGLINKIYTIGEYGAKVIVLFFSGYLAYKFCKKEEAIGYGFILALIGAITWNDSIIDIKTSILMSLISSLAVIFFGKLYDNYIKHLLKDKTVGYLIKYVYDLICIAAIGLFIMFVLKGYVYWVESAFLLPSDLMRKILMI